MNQDSVKYFSLGLVPFGSIERKHEELMQEKTLREREIKLLNFSTESYDSSNLN